MEKWEGLARKMGRSDSKQGRSASKQGRPDSKTGRSDSKKEGLVETSQPSKKNIQVETLRLFWRAIDR